MDQLKIYVALWEAMTAEATETMEGIQRRLKAQGKKAEFEVDATLDEFQMLLSVNGADEAPKKQLEIRLSCASLHEGDTGGNLRVTLHSKSNETWIEELVFAPYNYTEQCWTVEPEEIVSRLRMCDFDRFEELLMVA